MGSEMSILANKGHDERIDLDWWVNISFFGGVMMENKIINVGKWIIVMVGPVSGLCMLLHFG